MLLHDIPYDQISDAMIFVPQHVADPHDLSPRNLRLLGLNIGRKTASGLGDNLDTALNAMTKQPILIEIGERFAACRVLDALDRLKDGD